MEDFPGMPMSTTESETKFQPDGDFKIEQPDSVVIDETAGTPVIQIRKDNVIYTPVQLTIPNPTVKRKYVRKPKSETGTPKRDPNKPKRKYVWRNKKEPQPVGALDLTTTGPNSSLIGDSQSSYSNSQIITPVQLNGIATTTPAPFKITPRRRKKKELETMKVEMMKSAISVFGPKEMVLPQELPSNSVAMQCDNNKIITPKKVAPRKRKIPELVNANHLTNHIVAQDIVNSSLPPPISVDNIKTEPPGSQSPAKKIAPRKGRPKKCDVNILDVNTDGPTLHPALPEVDIKQESQTSINNDFNANTNVTISPKKKGRPKKLDSSINDVIKIEPSHPLLPQTTTFDGAFVKEEIKSCDPESVTKKRVPPRKGRPKKSVENSNNLNDVCLPSLPIQTGDNADFENNANIDDNHRSSTSKVTKRARKSQDSKGNTNKLVNGEGETCQSSAELQFPFDSRESEIDDNCINLHSEDDLDHNNDLSVFYSLTAEAEINLMNVINNVAKGEGEITPYCVQIQRCPKRNAERPRPLSRKKVVMTNLNVNRPVVDIVGNERVPKFQDQTNALVSVPGETCSGEDQGFMKIDQPEQNFKNRSVVNAVHIGVKDLTLMKAHAGKSEFDNCSLCKWNLRPTSDLEDTPKKKTPKFIYTPEEKHDLFSDGQFLVDQFDSSKCINEQAIWRVVDSCRCLQRFHPYEAGGRIFHHGTQHLHMFESKDEQFFQRFQPIYVIPIFEDKKFQIALYIFVERIHPFLVQISKTDDLFFSYKVVLQLIISANLQPNFIREELCREGGDLYYSENWERINSAIENRASVISSADVWSSTTFRLLADFPRVTFSKFASEKSKCLSCQHAERQAIFLVKCSGAPYDKHTFEPLPVPEISKTPFVICYFCTPILRSFVRLYHHRFFMYYCVQKNIIDRTTSFQKDEKCDPLELLRNLMSDHEWILKMFLDFQVVVAEADKSILLMNPKKTSRGIKKGRIKLNN